MRFEQLKAIILDVTGKSQIVEPESRLRRDLGISSFEMMVIIARIENSCGHQTNMELLRHDMTVNDLLDAVS